MADSQEFVFSRTCELTAEFGNDKCDFFEIFFLLRGKLDFLTRKMSLVFQALCQYLDCVLKCSTTFKGQFRSGIETPSFPGPENSVFSN